MCVVESNKNNGKAVVEDNIKVGHNCYLNLLSFKKHFAIALKSFFCDQIRSFGTFMDPVSLIKSMRNKAPQYTEIRRSPTIVQGSGRTESP